MTPFAPWLPDIVQFNPAVSADARNVIPPSATGFKPWPSFTSVSDALTERAQGAYTARGLTATIFNFAGDATKLYKVGTTGLTFSDVSRTVGGAYATSPDGWWQFTTFGDYVIACNLADATQVFQLSSSTNFAALGGSPPIAAFTGTIRDFVVLARTSTNYYRIQWSGINDTTAWTPSATTMSDYQDFPDGGIIKGFVGGEFGVVLQERAIQRMAFEGPPTIFRFDKISNTLGCQIEGSVASYENLVFFKAHDGMYMLRGGSELVPIGTEKIDRWLNSRINATYYYRCSAAIDPARKLYLFGYPSQQSADGTPDEILAYHWPSGEWSYAQINHEVIYIGTTQASYTIDDLASLSATIDGLVYPTDSLFYAGSGQLMISGFDTSHRHGFFTGAALEAVIETGDIQLNQGRKSMLRGARPMVEGTSVTPKLKVKYRDLTTEPHTTGSDVTVNSNGFCNFRVNARYHRGVMTIPAKSVWDRALGLDDLKESPMGAR